jgi:hypothetical protein
VRTTPLTETALSSQSEAGCADVLIVLVVATSDPCRGQAPPFATPVTNTDATLGRVVGLSTPIVGTSLKFTPREGASGDVETTGLKKKRHSLPKPISLAAPSSSPCLSPSALLGVHQQQQRQQQPFSTMIMDGLETLQAPNASALSDPSSVAASQHSFNVLCFDTAYKEPASSESGSSPLPAATGLAGTPSDPTGCEPAPGDLNTPVTTSGDIPTFFGPSTVVEPPPITGESKFCLFEISKCHFKKFKTS